MSDTFRHWAGRIATLAGSPGAFLAAVTLILVWIITGPVFHFSDTWQLFINTLTTIITFLMVFLIQNAQNRDAKAMQLKLDELIRSTEAARNGLIDIEHLSDDQLLELQESFRRLAEKNVSSAENILEELEDELDERDDDSQDGKDNPQAPADEDGRHVEG